MYSDAAVLETEVEVRRDRVSRTATEGKWYIMPRGFCVTREGNGADQISPARFDDCTSWSENEWRMQEGVN
jgi:hypothetical protein